MLLNVQANTKSMESYVRILFFNKSHTIFNKGKIMCMVPQEKKKKVKNTTFSVPVWSNLITVQLLLVVGQA